MRVVAERARRALRLPHRRRLRRVTRHGVAGAGAVLRGHLPIFHDLLDLGSFVLKPDFHLGGGEGEEGGTKAQVTGTLRGIFGPPRLWAFCPGPGPGAQPACPAPEGALAGSARRSRREGTTPRLSFVWLGGAGRGQGPEGEGVGGREEASVRSHVRAPAGPRGAHGTRRPRLHNRGRAVPAGAVQPTPGPERESLQVAHRSPRSPRHSLHPLPGSRKGQDPPAAPGGDSHILSSSLGLGVGGDGNRTLRGRFPPSNCAPLLLPPAPPLLPPTPRLRSSGEGSDPLSQLSRSPGRGLRLLWA